MSDATRTVLWCPAPGCEDLACRTRPGITGVVVHRIEVSQEDVSFADTPAEVARFFREHPIGKRATGGQMPYPILIDARGEVTQTVPLCRITPHAKSHNPRSIGVGVIGDFRKHPPTPVQWESLVLVCGDLLAAFGLTPDALRGHDELDNASSDPMKECPGRLLVMAELRARITCSSGSSSNSNNSNNSNNGSNGSNSNSSGGVSPCYRFEW